MYNGIGLTTARGSGTSGYVQKNLSHVKPFAQQKQKDSFLKELQALKVLSYISYYLNVLG